MLMHEIYVNKWLRRNSGLHKRNQNKFSNTILYLSILLLSIAWNSPLNMLMHEIYVIKWLRRNSGLHKRNQNKFSNSILYLYYFQHYTILFPSPYILFSSYYFLTLSILFLFFILFSRHDLISNTTYTRIFSDIKADYLELR